MRLRARAAGVTRPRRWASRRGGCRCRMRNSANAATYLPAALYPLTSTIGPVQDTGSRHHPSDLWGLCSIRFRRGRRLAGQRHTAAPERPAREPSQI